MFLFIFDENPETTSNSLQNENYSSLSEIWYYIKQQFRLHFWKHNLVVRPIDPLENSTEKIQGNKTFFEELPKTIMTGRVKSWAKREIWRETRLVFGDMILLIPKSAAET